MLRLIGLPANPAIRGVDVDVLLGAATDAGLRAEELAVPDREDPGERLFAFEAAPVGGAAGATDDGGDGDVWGVDVAAIAASLRADGFAVATGAAPSLVDALRDDVDALHGCDLLGASPNALATGGGGAAVRAKVGVGELQLQVAPGRGVRVRREARELGRVPQEVLPQQR